MTLPIYLAVHLAYGTIMAHILVRRMLAEGEVLGVPLVATIAPVGLITAPLGAVLLRYSGGWFLHGMLIGDGSIPYERFHFGLMLLVGLSAGMVTVAGMFIALALVTREHPRLARAPIVVAIGVAGLAVALDFVDVFIVPGSSGRFLFFHPAGLVSFGIAATLVAMVLFARRRLHEVPVTGPMIGPQRSTMKSIPLSD